MFRNLVYLPLGEYQVPWYYVSWYCTRFNSPAILLTSPEGFANLWGLIVQKRTNARFTI